MQDPVGVEVVNPIEYLVQKRLNHVLGNLLRLLISLGSPVVLDNVLGTSRDEKTVVGQIHVANSKKILTKLLKSAVLHVHTHHTA